MSAGEGVLPTGAAQEAAVPPFEPVHAQSHGPVPVTIEALPAAQRFVVGVLPTGTPFAEPHEPLTSCGNNGAEQDAVLPPDDPLQLHPQGPLPVTVEAVPRPQRFVAGAVLTAAPFAEPQEPLTVCCDRTAEQDAVAPPCDPWQLHAQGPLPVTVEGLPAPQRFTAGAAFVTSPFAEPHEPLICSCAEQLADVPPPEPAHAQFHGPVPVTDEAAPAPHRFAVGATLRFAPFEEPQTALMAVPAPVGTTVA